MLGLAQVGVAAIVLMLPGTVSARAGDGIAPSAAPFPLGDTFKLHTDPGADRILYLDFDGGTYEPGPPPNTPIPDQTSTIPPFGGTLSFSDATLERIQRIWQRVAEDYAPFALDVTTEQPTEVDLENCADRCGAKVSIGGESQDVQAAAGVRGIGPTGVSFGVRTRPTVFVFSAPMNEDEHQVAETITNTAGLSFDLVFDGTTNPSATFYTGHGSWCPIMGDCFTKTLSQWSRGEYPKANNQEDDLAKIAAIAPIRADDVVGEAPLSGAAGLVDQTGVIATAADADTFTFASVAGPATFTVQGAITATNLNAHLTLLDGSGAVVAQADDPDGLGATLSVTLTAGTHRLRVDGVGDLDPLPGFSDYGSLGRYRITGSYAPGVGGGPGPADTTAPAFMGRSRATPARFLAARRARMDLGALAAAKGTTFVYELSERATVSFLFQRRTTGRRVGGRCRKTTRRNSGRKRCTRFVRAGALGTGATGGVNRTGFNGFVRGRALKPGRYRALLTALDDARNRSSEATVSFRVLKPKPRRKRRA